MGDTKLCLWLLLCTVVFTNAQEEEATCFLAKRFKSFQKYEYSYETESLNALNGEINGPRATCKVEIEVPGSCTYILHTSQCSLMEVTHVDAEGKPVFGDPAGADAFRMAMEKYPLKFTADGDHDISLFPEDGEPVNILNIKRGLISALAAPAPKEQRSKRMPTIYGPCTTGYTETSAEDVTLHRDLTTCDHFRPARDHTSPLALITGLNYPLAQLMRSSQTCNYMFDAEQKHMTSASCTENHIFVPFSYKRQYGFTNVGKQVLTLEGVSVHNDRIFDHNEANMKSLHLDGSIAAVHPIHDKDAMLTVLTELTGLSKTDDGQNRAPLAHKLVDVVRKMDAEALTAALPEALEASRSLTYQALFQCGTPECTIAILQVLRTLDSSSLEIDAAVYAMGMVPNPSAVLVKEMLEMAKFKSSKPIFYALSNAVRRLYKKEGMVTPEIQAVFDYMRDQIGDCTGNQDHLFLTLRVIGNMAVGDTGSDLKSAVLQCVNQPLASAEVQLAAVQVFRDITLSEQDREVLMQVVLDEAAPVQKCVAAYLVLMKNPLPSELAQLLPALAGSSRLQFRSFVNSHLSNILSSSAPETKGLREKILNVLQGNEIEKGLNPMQYSRNYKIGSLEGNVIFESTDLLPNEAVLEMTLNAFGFDIDVFEIGLNGKGLEPAVDALVGIDGFFADTMKKTINYAAEKIPRGNEVLHKMFPKIWSDIKMKQVPQSIIKEITSNVNKLIQTLKAQDNPEAMIYLRLLGAELGYVNTKDVAEMASSAGLLASSLLKMFPANFIRNLFSSINNDLFLHYIFMDHEFYLPTGAGVPLRVAFSGTFAPGAKGGLMLAKDKSEVAFMPSAGVEFVTEVGALLPEYVESGLEMHTNFYHESGLRATVDVKVNQVKLSIPAPQSPAKLFSVTNSLVSVTGEKSRVIPAVTDPISVEKCFPFLPGLKSCSSLHYSPAFSSDTSPYFPLTGDSKFALELRPTGEVSAYTLTLSHTSDEKTDTMSLDLKAEGASFESTAKVTFDREENTLAASLEIPTYDVEAGITVKPKTKVDARSVQIDFLNKKIVQASLVALAEIETDRDVQLQVQLLVPRLQTDAKVTAKLQFDEALTVELESDLQLPETSSVQKVLFKYDAFEKLELTFTSDVNSEIHNSISTDAIKAIVEKILDQEIGQSGTKIRDVFTQTVTASSEYLEKYAVDIPYLQKLAVPEITVPEKFFMNVEGAAQFKFGQRFYSVIIPLPFVEEIARDLNLPRALQRDHTSLTLPLAGQLEMSSKLSSNFYNMEASASIGKDDEESRYSAIAEVTGTSTEVELLSFKTEGSAAVAVLSEEAFQAEVKSSFSHKLLETQFRVLEEVTSADKIKIKSSSKFEASSPLGLKVSLEHTGQVGAAAEEISGDGQLLSSVEVGPVNSEASLKQSLVFFPLKTEAKMDSSLKVDSAFIQTENLIEVVLINGEASFVSKTTAFGDSLTNTAEITYKDSVVSLKSDTKAKALDFNFQNSAEASVGPYMVNFRVETAGDKIEDPVTGGFRSMVSAALDENGLALHSDASASLAEHTASHKCMLSLTSIGFSTSGTTSLKSPLSFENKFEGALDAAKLSFTSETMGKFAEMTIKNTNALSATLSTLTMTTKADAKIADGTSYNHAISLQLEPYSTLVSINNHLAVLHVNLINDARFSAQGYKADLTGSVKLAAGSEELKHTYEFRYADLAATAKFGTSGKLLGSHVSHNAEVEIAGAAVTFRDEARFTSAYLRFDGTVNAVAVPFKLNIDAIANADGDVYFYGKHSGQFYTKFLLKAEPLAIAHSHECRVSTTQNLNNGLMIETNLDKKTDTVLTPSEQKATVLVKSKLNGHVFSQEYKAYNTPEKLGLEASGSMITNLFNTQSSEGQDHFYSAFIKYDKNTNSRIISLPFLRNILENIKMSIVRVAEAMQSFINREDTVENIQKLAKKVGDAVSQLNLKSRVEEITKDLTDFYQQKAISINDLEDYLMTFKPALLQLITDLDAHLEKISEIAKEMIASGSLSDSVVQKLSEINEKYDIRAMVVAIIEMIEDVIKQIDLNELKESSAVFFQNLEEQYDIRIKLEETVSKLKQMVADFDQVKFVDDVRSFMNSIAFQDYADRMMAQIPTEKISKIVEAVKELVTRLDIAGKCKTMCDKVREILANCEARKKFEAIFDKVVELMRKLKIEDTFRVLADTLSSVQIPAPQLLDEAITYVKTRQVKEIIEDWNTCLDKCIRHIRSFDYNAFVDKVNQNVRKHTAELNRVMSSLEIQQKLDAVREFVAYALSTVSACFEKIVNVPAFDLPEIVLPEISFPDIPKFIAQHELTDLSIPEFNLPAIPSELEIPCLGKLYGEVKVSIPVFNMRTTIEFYNSTETAETPQFSGYITSQGSSEYDFLKYSLDSTSRIAMPKMSRVIVAETLKVTHQNLAVEHQSSLTLYGFSAQASSKSTVKIVSDFYSADVLNTAFFGLEDGMSANSKTTYNDKVNIPYLSIKADHSYDNEIVFQQDGLSFIVNMQETGKGKVSANDVPEDFNYKGNTRFSITPTSAQYTSNGEANTPSRKSTQVIKIDAALSYIDFNARIENSDSGKSYLFNAAGMANLKDMKVELKATQESAGMPVGFSNSFTFLMRPIEMRFDSQNKANGKIGIPGPLSAKFELQNDYAAILSPTIQKISTMALAQFNQYKYFHNFTAQNNKVEAGIYADVNGEANLEFLTVPVTVPSVRFSFPVTFETPEIRNFNLYEHTGLKHLLTTLDQTVDADAKIVYQKSKARPLIETSLIRIPSFGSLVSETSFKSSVLSLNANANVHAKENFVVRVSAASASVFEGLNATLEGTSSLSTKSGLKLATAVVLDNRHIDGTHKSTVSVDLQNFEVTLSSDTQGKVDLPFVKAKGTHELVSDNKPQPKAESTLKVEYSFDIPVIKLIGSGDAQNSLKLEATPEFISTEAALKAKLDAVFLDSGSVKANIDHDETFYLNGNSLRSSLKTVGDSHLIYKKIKLEFDVDESFSLEAAAKRVFALLKFSSKNNAQVGALETRGVNSAQATYDLDFPKSLMADVKVDLSQPNPFGDLAFSEVMSVELTVPKQTLQYTTKFISPLYNLDVAAKLDGNAPVFKSDLKASATSPIAFFDYDLDSSMTTSVEGDASFVESKAVLTHADFTLDINNNIRMSVPSQTLKVDISSPTFSDLSLLYVAASDGLTTSVYTPTTGHLRVQLKPATPSVRVSRGHAASPDNDVDILTVRAVRRDEKLHLVATYDSAAVSDLCSDLREKLPDAVSSLHTFADKHGVLGVVHMLRHMVVSAVDEAHVLVSTHSPELTQLSRFFRNVIVRYQKAIKNVFDAIVTFLRETQFQLPGMEKNTLPDLCQRFRSAAAKHVQHLILNFMETLEMYLAPYMEELSKVSVTFPSGDVLTLPEIQEKCLEFLKFFLRELVSRVDDIESSDVILEDLGKALQEVVEKTQEFVDSIQSDSFDVVFSFVNTCHELMVSWLKFLVDTAEDVLTFEQVSSAYDQHVQPVFTSVLQLLSDGFTAFSNNFGTNVRFTEGKLEIEFPY